MRRIKRKKSETTFAQKKESTFFPSLQTKLSIGKADDSYEKEADNVADNVVNNSENQGSVQKMESEEDVQQKPLSSSITPLIQREESSEEDVQNKNIQKKEEEERAKRTKELKVSLI